ncbi:EAL domain-containing protein [Sulfurimonas sp. HSL-1716]|uniref:EAL domain-containing protein n=1 Tax=Hydrocurvibacter sulfurireducens TaxID=3131937 RepID=UPI0031F975B7
MEFLSKLNVNDVLNCLPDPILIIDTLGNIKFCNESFSNLLNYETDEMQDKNIINYLIDDSIVQECLVELYENHHCLDQSAIFITKDKKHVTTTKNLKLIKIDDEEYIFINIRDVSRIERINYELSSSKRELEERSKQLSDMLDDHKKQIVEKQLQLDEIINIIDEIIWYIDDKTMEIKYVSNAIEHIFGEKKEDFLNDVSLWINMIHEEDKQSVMNFFHGIKPSKADSIEFRIRKKEGSIRWLSSTITHHPSLNFFIGVTHDITQKKKDQQNMEFMAYHDVLTSLPNRSFLKNEINALLKRSQIIQQNFAVLFLDLDNFKYINDSMGHDIGDELLVKVSHRLSGTIGTKGICTRFGGDEFVILMQMQNKEDITIKAQQIIDSLTSPFKVEDHEFFITSSIGISIYPDDANNATELIKSADTAMYESKLAGKNRYSFFDTAMNTSVKEFLEVETHIKDAIAHDYFELYFQPLVDSSTSTLYGFEALLRLIHPKHGSIPPDKFIPVAEATGDIHKIGEFVMQNACRFAKRVNELSSHEIFVSINISSRQFKESSFAETFLKHAADYGVNPNLLKVEMTESILMNDIALTVKELDLLCKAGVKVALDDFGTGYSSFEYLAQLPVNTIKIDKSFIIPVFEKKSNEHIVTAITSLAHALNMDVTAEGVETDRHARYLKENNVDVLQGFYYSKALPADEIINNIDEYKNLFNL